MTEKEPDRCPEALCRPDLFSSGSSRQSAILSAVLPLSRTLCFPLQFTVLHLPT